MNAGSLDLVRAAVDFTVECTADRTAERNKAVEFYGMTSDDWSAYVRQQLGYDQEFHAALYRDVCVHRRWQPELIPFVQLALQRSPGLAAALIALQPDLSVPQILQRITAADVDGAPTEKLQLRLADGAVIETVIIPMGHGRHYTVCVSSQVGCRMGCGFCQTARLGLVRQVTAAEIIGQFIVAAQCVGVMPRNIVFMGMGEPLDNVMAVAQAVRILTDRRGFARSPRHITVSTVGRIDVFPRLAELGLMQVNLAISVMVADDDERSRFMPVNRQFPLAQVRTAIAGLALPAGRKVMISCTLIGDINDSDQHAYKLITFLRDLPVFVNVIPYNPIPGQSWQAPSAARLLHFRQVLEQAGITVRQRTPRGDQTMAACGQLGDQAFGRAGLKRRSEQLDNASG